jgi:hypothetical protein
MAKGAIVFGSMLRDGWRSNPSQSIVVNWHRGIPNENVVAHTW